MIRRPDELATQAGPGWTRLDWAGAAAFGEDVPMEARRYRLDPGASADGLPLAGQEAFVSVIAGSGTARAGGDALRPYPRLLYLRLRRDPVARGGLTGGGTPHR